MPEFSPEVAGTLYVAFDFDSVLDQQPQELLTSIHDTDVGAKVGTQIAAVDGWLVPVDEVDNWGLNVFADMKLKDIGATVIKTARPVLRRNPAFLNVHADSSVSALEGLVAERDTIQAHIPVGQRTKLLGVTVLTDKEDPEVIQDYRRGRKKQVLHYADKSMAAGLDGVVCSPAELKVLARYERFFGAIKMTPAIRPRWSVPDDQKNFMTPTEALERGGENTLLVVGRPITEQYAKIGKTPLDAVHAVLEEVKAARTA